MIKTFYCFRHGQTDWNKLNKLQGCEIDLSLNEKGREQAGEIPHIEIDIIYSSPLKRAFETAEIYNGKHNVDIIIDEGFKEADFGDWTGLGWGVIQYKYADTVKKIRSIDEKDDSCSFPNGSLKADVINTFITSLKNIGNKCEFNNIGVFSHGRALYFVSNKISNSNEVIHVLKNSQYLKIQYNTEQMN
jgi:phosphoserine phosphatase